MYIHKEGERCGNEIITFTELCGLYHNYSDCTVSLMHPCHLFLPKHMQRWARAYRDNIYHAAVETNNGAEALNRMLKYSYLPKQKHMTLSHIITKITNEFLPALHYKYVFKNFKQSELYRSYNPSIVPDYLQGRPKQTILHCLHRQASSNKFVASDITQVNPSLPIFQVKSSKGTHTLDFGIESGEPSCSCKDWITHHIPCKHFFAVFNHHPQWGWDQLPSSYKASPYLSLDNATISKYIASDIPEQMDDTTEDGGDVHHSNFDQLPRKVHGTCMYHM